MAGTLAQKSSAAGTDDATRHSLGTSATTSLRPHGTILTISESFENVVDVPSLHSRQSSHLMIESAISLLNPILFQAWLWTQKHVKSTLDILAHGTTLKDRTSTNIR